jgi:hypothetical protein
MSTRLCAIAMVLMLLAPGTAAMAVVKPILGTIPAYPGASRPLIQLETKARAIALTTDKPEAVVDYYIRGLVAAGWTPLPEVIAEAEAAKIGQPAWLTFTRRGGARIDIQVTTGLHPRTGKPVTLITYLTEYPTGERL